MTFFKVNTSYIKNTIVMLSCFITTISMMGCNGNSKGSQASHDTVSSHSIVDDSARIVTIAMTGDIMTGTTYPTPWLPPNDGKEIFNDCKEILRNADVACGNLEGVLADSGNARKAGRPGTFSFLMPTKSVDLLVDAGYDFLGLANNHIFDFSEEGCQSTVNTLQKAGMGFAGIKDAEYSIREINGVRYGFCAFGFKRYNLSVDDSATVKRIITQLRPKVDIVIVSFHAGREGAEFKHLPHGLETHAGQSRGNARVFAHQCIDYGADIVYGHSPHVCRAMELYKGHLIAYSLGNFATPTGMRLEGERGYAPVVTARLDRQGKLIDGKIHSFIQRRNVGPRRDTTCKVAKEIMTLTREDINDNKLNIAPDGTITIKET